ncbi:antibiotic biosynthesis monooxygenase [Pseudonocardia sp. DSM 110487]|uniref:putative quinol monooxygenase n=1 Tax=Pseudonocardia sp. DSM 110487 TaxID=2865833 RepID=UPI001C6A07DE|nr:antibiotic biosynthesis monooxygenase family protein [Pseudonocardia sp. DSM 110487]QYN38858.1 antibiotic biosynthesis monooxygenase [Pseudonocardia sp. DSM 110487]
MAVVALLEVQVDAESLQTSYDIVRETLKDTRAFDGCLSADVLVDRDDPAHLVMMEKWESFEHDAAYRAWRAGPGAAVKLAAVLVGKPKLSVFAEHPEI